MNSLNYYLKDTRRLKKNVITHQIPHYSQTRDCLSRPDIQQFHSLGNPDIRQFKSRDVKQFPNFASLDIQQFHRCNFLPVTFDLTVNGIPCQHRIVLAMFKQSSLKA